MHCPAACSPASAAAQAGHERTHNPISLLLFFWTQNYHVAESGRASGVLISYFL
jgi:hypothetical protein